MTARRGLGVGVPSFGTGFFTSSHREKKRARMTSIGFHLDPRRVPEKHSSDLSGLRRGTLGLSLPKGFTGFFSFLLLLLLPFRIVYIQPTVYRYYLGCYHVERLLFLASTKPWRGHHILPKKNVHRQNKLANPKRSRPYGAH